MNILGPVSYRVPITVRIHSFEGPLDLLLYLIQSNELDISRISISKITDQYLAYVRIMQELDFDVASEFLVMAATLIQWKSKAILPKEEDPNALLDDEDDALSENDLLRQLLEHRRFLAAGDELAALPKLGEDLFHRPNKKPPIDRVWRDMNASDLALTYQDLLVRERKRSRVLRKETVSLAGKIRQFAEKLIVGKMTELSYLMETNPSLGEKVVTFLASLELGKLKKLKVLQQETYDPIYVELLEKFESLDLQITSALETAEREASESSNTGADSPSAVAEPEPATL